MKEKEMTRILCKWNRKEMTSQEVVIKIWKLYEQECLKTWNDPLESLLVEDK